jgi:hypothetical protein
MPGFDEHDVAAVLAGVFDVNAKLEEISIDRLGDPHAPGAR